MEFRTHPAIEYEITVQGSSHRSHVDSTREAMPLRRNATFALGGDLITVQIHAVPDEWKLAIVLAQGAI